MGQGQTKFQCLTGKLILMVISSVRNVSEGPVRQQWGRDKVPVFNR